MKILIAFYLLWVGTASARAQQPSFSLGPRVGLNAATYHSAQLHDYETQGYRVGLEAGLASTVNFGHLGLQAAVLYAQRGATLHADIEFNSGSGTGNKGTYDASSRLNCVTMPLALAYNQRTDGQGAQLFAGPYFSLLLNGHYDNTLTSPSGGATSRSGAITPVNDEALDLATHPVPAYRRRFDAGLQGGLGYRYHALLFQASYSLGLQNAMASFTYNGAPVNHPASYNRAFQASLSYLFGLTR